MSIAAHQQWPIRRFIDKDAHFEFLSKDDPMPEDAIAFTLPRAEIKPIEGKKTTYDILVKYRVKDPSALQVGKLTHDFEIDAEENPSRVKLRETMGLCHVLKGLEKTSKSDHETTEKAIMVLDAFCASFKQRLGFSRLA